MVRRAATSILAGWLGVCLAGCGTQAADSADTIGDTSQLDVLDVVDHDGLVSFADADDLGDAEPATEADSADSFVRDPFAPDAPPTDVAVAPDIAAGDASADATSDAPYEDIDENTGPSPWCGPVSEADLAAQAALFDTSIIVPIDLGLDAAAQQALTDAPYEYVNGAISIDGGPPQPVGLRLKGGGDGEPANGSFQPLGAKPAFKVDVNRVIDCAHLYGLKKLTLNNMVQDPSRLHEWLGYRVFELAGLPAPRVGWVSLTVNGEPHGLYLHVETYDQPAFLDRFFDSTQHLYEEDQLSDFTVESIGRFDVDKGDPDDLSDLLAAATLLMETEGEADLMTSTAAAFDWDAIVPFLATERFIDHWDGYTGQVHNYHAHSDASGRFTLLPWGLDMAWRDATEDLHQGVGVLFDRCLEDEACTAGFDLALEQLVKLVGDHDLPAEVAAMAAHVLPQVATDTKAPGSLEEHQDAVSWLESFVTMRATGL